MSAAVALASSSPATALLSFSSRSLFASLFSPKSHLLFFSTSRSFATRMHVLRPTADRDGGEYGKGENSSTDPSMKSRNELKREARLAVRWGMELAAFSPSQIKRILRAAALEREVLDAILLVKRLGPDVREGRRRQFNYIGRLLRNAQPELMNALILASKDGDISRVQVLVGQETPFVDGNEDDEEDGEEEIESEGEESKIYLEVADKWFDGLIYKDPSITREVYSLHIVDFDRQELRRLVRQLQSIKTGQHLEVKGDVKLDIAKHPQSIQEGSHNQESGLKGDAKLARAKKPLLRFLRSLAKKSLAKKGPIPLSLAGTVARTWLKISIFPSGTT